MSDFLVADEDWQVLQTFLPDDWKDLATTTHALKGLRQDKSPAKLLRTMLLHVGCGHSLRESVVRAREAGLSDMSDVALLKRLRKCENWFHALAVALWRQRGLPELPAGKRIIRVVDATTVKEPGKTGSVWRIHYSLQLPTLMCDFFKLTATEGEGTAEGFRQIPVQKGEYLMADRGYSITEGIDSLVRAGAYVLVRLNQGAVRLTDNKGRRFELLPNLEQLKQTAQVGTWEVGLEYEGGQVRGRICALRKTRAAIEKAHRKLKRKASKLGRELKAETLEYARFVTVFTTFPVEEFSAAEILEWYRIRWQIELVFKRFKQIAGLGHLPKHDEQSARAWLYGKLVVALLTERLIQYAGALSPWGYEFSTVREAQRLA